MRGALWFPVSIAISLGCSGGDATKPDASGAEPLRTTLPLDASIGALTDAQVDQFCEEAAAWAHRETQRYGVAAIRRGMCVSRSEFAGRAYPETYLATCNEEYPRCMAKLVDPEAFTAVGSCALKSGRSKCVAFPTLGELVACYEAENAVASTWFLSLADKTCADYATTPLKVPDEPAACDVVFRKCGTQSIY